MDYSYDGYGNRTGMTDSLGGSLNYSYDLNNNLTSLALSLSGTQEAQITFAYDTNQRLTGMTETAGTGSHTIAASYSYDSGNRLTNITYTDKTATITLASYTYGYDAASNLTSYQDNSGNSLTYGYDKDVQLLSASGTLNNASYSVSYSYDANGNRNMTGYTTGKGNELTSDGTYNYGYDNEGNMTSQTDIATGNVTYYTWDYQNRLTEVKQETSNGTVLNDEKFTYDVNGNRIGVSLNGTQQLYTVYDGSNPYMDFNGSGTLTERYVTNPKALNQFFGQVSASGTTEWFLTDNINSIRQVISSSGSALDAITYAPYGNIINQANSPNAPRFLYTGAAYDSISGTYLDGVREDNPLDGHWLNQDPLGFVAGETNLYRYVGNDPTNSIDPAGQCGCPPMFYGPPVFYGTPVYYRLPTYGPTVLYGPPIAVLAPEGDEPQGVVTITRTANYGPESVMEGGEQGIIFWSNWLPTLNHVKRRGGQVVGYRWVKVGFALITETRTPLGQMGGDYGAFQIQLYSPFKWQFRVTPTDSKPPG